MEMERMILNRNDKRSYLALKRKLNRGWTVRSVRALNDATCKLQVAPAGEKPRRYFEDDFPDEREEA